ncbi:alpha/beta hydrolase [Aquimarina hainanensis]|uniref:Alpha/beta hydrolase n=1 Tax=Aquimarina hainanensis TaxID=1578017 RepID=A0ABW5N433_9FLAO
MKKSFTYYLTIWVLQLKGVKKLFKTSPINYKKLRKEDVLVPKTTRLTSHKTTQFKIEKTILTEIAPAKVSDGLLLFIHGGAFVAGPSKHHWDSLLRICKQTDLTLWMCAYPKAPEHTITEISQNIDAVYQYAISKYPPSSIVLMGDSAGGTLATALTQRLISEKIVLPKTLILISPVMDASFSTPKIAEVDHVDPMLSVSGALSAKKMCAENDDLKNPMLSPVHGSFIGFPKTILFIAERDITYPDQLISLQKIVEADVDHEVITGKDMPHIWPLLPVMKEAKQALQQIICFLK